MCVNAVDDDDVIYVDEVMPRDVKDDFCLCEHDNCLGFTNASESNFPKDEDCLICNNPFKNGVGILRNCGHIFCLTCLLTWRVERRSFNCPLCRQLSYTAIYSNRIYNTEQKERIFRLHVKCLTSNDPLLNTCFSEMNDQWLNFVEIMLSSESHRRFKGINTLDLNDYGHLVRSGRNFAVFKSPHEEWEKIVICCKMRNFSVRMAISINDSKHMQPDNEYADEVVGYFNQQLIASWEAIPFIMKNVEDRRILVRKFKNITCLLLMVGVREGFQSYSWPVPMSSHLSEVRKTNIGEDLYNMAQFVLPFHLCTCLRPDCTIPRVRQIRHFLNIDM